MNTHTRGIYAPTYLTGGQFDEVAELSEESTVGFSLNDSNSDQLDNLLGMVAPNRINITESPLHLKSPLPTWLGWAHATLPRIAEDTAPPFIGLDCEVFGRTNEEDTPPEIASQYEIIYDTYRTYFPNSRIAWYDGGRGRWMPKWDYIAGECYRLPDLDKTIDEVTAAEHVATAEHKRVCLWVALNAGYRTVDGTSGWLDPWDYGIEHVVAFAEYIKDRPMIAAIQLFPCHPTGLPEHKGKVHPDWMEYYRAFISTVLR